MPRFLAALAVVLLVAGCADSEPRTLAPGPHSGPPEASRQPVSPELTGKLAAARAASARFVTDLAAAEKAGYVIITKMMANMGFHYLNPKIDGFDVTKPAILVYVKNGSGWQLGPDGGAPFGFWHPTLTTLHVWLWYHNPDGLFHPTNPLVPSA